MILSMWVMIMYEADINFYLNIFEPEKVQNLLDDHYSGEDSWLGGLKVVPMNKGEKYNFELDDYWIGYDDEEVERFLNLIAKYVKGSINLKGEDGEYWKFVFDGEGNWKELDGRIVYGDLLELVIKTYDLPDSLRERLVEWQVANKI